MFWKTSARQKVERNWRRWRWRKRRSKRRNEVKQNFFSLLFDIYVCLIEFKIACMCSMLCYLCGSEHVWAFVFVVWKFTGVPVPHYFFFHFYARSERNRDSIADWFSLPLHPVPIQFVSNVFRANTEEKNKKNKLNKYSLLLTRVESNWFSVQ